MKGAKTVDDYLAAHEEQRPALEKLRKVLLETELEECIKWGAPCYTLGGKNVVGIAAFKNYVGLWFHQGVFLADPDGVLVNAQEGKTKALRQWRFEGAKDIKLRQVRAYVREAIANQAAGKALTPTRKSAGALPDELREALAAAPRVEESFAQLTPGRRREYADYVREAKRSETKARRIAKILPLIEAGVGLHDKYRNC